MMCFLFLSQEILCCTSGQGVCLSNHGENLQNVLCNPQDRLQGAADGGGQLRECIIPCVPRDLATRRAGVCAIRLSNFVPASGASQRRCSGTLHGALPGTTDCVSDIDRKTFMPLF